MIIFCFETGGEGSCRFKMDLVRELGCDHITLETEMVLLRGNFDRITVARDTEVELFGTKAD